MAKNFNARYMIVLQRRIDVLKPFAEHLGLLAQQEAWNSKTQPTASMSPAPAPHEYDFGSESDKLVQDMLSDEFQELWIGTGRRNRAAFEHVFRPVPNDTIRNWKGYVEYLTPNAGISVGQRLRQS